MFLEILVLSKKQHSLCRSYYEPILTSLMLLVVCFSELYWSWALSACKCYVWKTGNIPYSLNFESFVARKNRFVTFLQIILIKESPVLLLTPKLFRDKRVLLILPQNSSSVETLEPWKQPNNCENLYLKHFSLHPEDSVTCTGVLGIQSAVV